MRLPAQLEQRLVRGHVRILMRREGPSVNAYLAPVGTTAAKSLVLVASLHADADAELIDDVRQALAFWLEREIPRAGRRATVADAKRGQEG